MIEQITLGQTATTLAFIATFAGSIVYLKKNITKWIKESLKDDFEAIDKKISALHECVDKTDLEKTKNFLVARLADVEKGNDLNPIELQRLYEQFEHYTKHGGNSYIAQEMEKLQKEGKI